MTHDPASPTAASPPPYPRRPWRVLRAYLLLPHALPVLVVLGATLGFALLFTDGQPPTSVLARLLLAMLGGQVAIGAVNEIVDADLDASTKLWKPIPAGDVSPRAATMVTVAGLLTMLLFGTGFGPLPLALLLLGTGIGLAYDRWFKRTLLSWLPYLLALPLLPLWVRTALVGFDPRLLLLFPLGACAVVGVHLAQTLPDVRSDRAAGLRNLASVLGERRAIVACWAGTLSAPLLAVLLSPGLTERLAPVWAAAAVVLLLLAVDVALYLWRPPLGVTACFPCVAVATAAMGLGWVVAVGS